MDGLNYCRQRASLRCMLSADGARLFLVALRGWVELGR